MDTIVLAIDLGGTKILTSVVDGHGKVLSSDRTPTPPGGGQEAVVGAMLASGERALAQAGKSIRDLKLVGVAVPGPTDQKKGLLYVAPNIPGWRNVALGGLMQQAFGCRTYVINDANAAALGELHYGAGRGKRDFVYITVSTGIGGGIIVGGKIYLGAAGTAGEFGHMVIEANGPQCNCGNRGCWEMLASGTAMAAEAKRLIASGRQTSIKVDPAAPDRLSAEMVHEAARAGDTLAKEVVERGAFYLGVGLANILNIFSPELIIIGGGLSNMGDMLLRPAYEEAKRRAFKQPYDANQFVQAALGSDSGVLGVAGFLLEELNKQ